MRFVCSVWGDARRTTHDFDALASALAACVFTYVRPVRFIHDNGSPWHLGQLLVIPLGRNIAWWDRRAAEKRRGENRRGENRMGERGGRIT